MKNKDIFRALFIWMVLLWASIPAVMAEESSSQEQSQTNNMTLKKIPKELFLILPFGRDFTTLFTILPGINKEDLLSGLSVYGASGAENRFFVDGAETTNLLNGTSAQQVNLDFAESIQVKTFGFEASEDAAMGGTVRVITRSGTNQFHGQLTGYFNSNWLSGEPRKYLSLDVNDSSKATYYTHEEWVGIEDWHRIEPGIFFSGPILKNKLWFYGAFMPTFYKMDRTCDFALQGYDGNSKEYTRKETHMNYMLKLTSQPAKNIHFGASLVNNFFKYKGRPQKNHNGYIPDSYWISGYENSYEHHTETKFFIPNFTISSNADITMKQNFMINIQGSYFYSNEYEKRVAKSKPSYGFAAEQPYGYCPTTNEKWAWEYTMMGHSDKVWPATNRPTSGNGLGVQKNVNKRIGCSFDLTYLFSGLGEHTIQSGIQFTGMRQTMDDRPPVRIYFAWDMDLDLYGTHYGRGEYGWVGVRGNSKSPFGSIYDVRMEQWAIYLQDNWTIGDRLTLNMGIRTESEYIPSYSDIPELADLKPIKFSFADKISPRLGFVYDVKGDGNLKIFGHFGIYQDHMKLNMAAGAFGGFKWYSAYYPLDTLGWWEMDGEMNGQEPWAVVNHRIPDLDVVDPDMKPMTQREISLGFQKVLSQNLILSGHLINKSLLWAIEDTETYLPRLGYYYFYTNPGSDFIKEKYQISRDAGLMESDTPDLPRAKREYWGVTLNLEKRFANNWMGGISVTWSSLRGNYSGLVSADENGRNAPYTERVFDLWHLSFTKDQQPIDGPLPTDRPFVAKAYGSYLFPFGLTLGAVFNTMSGTPVTEEWNVDSLTYFPYGRGNMNRTPFLLLADLLVGYDIHIGKVTLNLNATIQNLLNAKTATGIYEQKTRFGISPTDREKIDNSWTFNGMGARVDPRFGRDNEFVPPIQVRLGAKISF